MQCEEGGIPMNVGRWVQWWDRIAGDAVALIFEEQTLSYSDLNTRVNRVASALIERGVSAGDRVGALLTNCPEYLETFFACAKIGAVFVPLNIRLAPRELAYIVGNAELSLLVSESAFGEMLKPVRDQVNLDSYVSLDGGDVGMPWQDFLKGASEANPPGDVVSWDDNLAICYTSGTTGLPKGAVLTHGNVFYSTVQLIVSYGFDQRDTHLMTLPLCFTGGLIPASMPIFHSGGTMVLEREFEPGRALDLIESHGVSIMMGVPVMYQLMGQQPDFDDRDLSSFRVAMSGGAPVPVPLIHSYQARGVPFTGGYGITEGTGYNMYLPPKDVVKKTGAYLPCLYNEAQVVDEEGTPTAADEVGELVLRGPIVFKEYWRNPEATTQTIRDGWLHTGDLARVDAEGYFYPVDRLKDMVITGGLNVYPAEVENVLFEHPSVSEVAVVGIDHPQWGEAVTAFVVAKDGESIGEEELRELCTDALADYKRPKEFVIIDELPRNVSGKILKRTLRDEYRNLFTSEQPTA